MKAIKIKMKSDCYYSNNLTEIDRIYITECANEGYFKKETLYDYLKDNPGSIKVNLYPYPVLEPAVSRNGEKYVRSKGDSTDKDNLLKLPRE